MTFRRINRVALKRLAGPVTITPPGGELYECRGLFERPHDDGHSGDANVRRPDPVLYISDEETVALTRGAAVEVHDADGVYIGPFTLQRAQPDEESSGLIRLDLRGAKA